MILAFDISGPVLVLGALTGILYGLLAVGLVLVYRTNRVINCAHGEIGAFGAALFSLCVVRWGLPYWLMLPVAMLAAAAVGGTAEVVAIRRLSRAPSLMSVVVTLGIGQLLLSLSAAMNPSALSGLTFPSPPWMPTFDVGALRVTPAYSAMLILGPIVVQHSPGSCVAVGGDGLFVRLRPIPKRRGSTASQRRVCRRSRGPSPRRCRR